MPTSRPTTWLHWLALALFGVLLAGVATQPLWHDDIFWHLRTGELIVRSGRVPRVDLFTHTVYGQPWTSHEWGFALLLYALYRTGGYAALVGLMTLLALLAFSFSYAQMRRALPAARRAIAIPLLLLGLGAAARSCFVLRAALLSSCLLGLLGTLLWRLHQEDGLRREAAICALFLFWANCHAGVVFGLVVLAGFWLQAVRDAYRERRAGVLRLLLSGRSRRRTLLVLACTGLTLVNPNGFDLWTFPFRVNKLFYGSGLHWNMGQYRSPALAKYPAFYVLLAACLLACLPLSRLKEALLDSRRPLLAQGPGTLFFLIMALRSNRFIFDFVVLALPFCALLWGVEQSDSQPIAPRAAALWRSPWPGLANVALLLAVLAWVRPALPKHALARSVPQRLATFMQQQHIAGRMFNYEASGGYLGWRLRQPVYWDGRNDIFGPLAVELAYAEDFGQLVRRHRLQMLILDPIYDARYRAYLDAHRDSWALVYWDDHAALYLARAPQFAPVIARWEYRLLRPFVLPNEVQVRRLARDPALRAQAQTEARRVLSLNADVCAGWYVRGELACEAGDLAAAQRLLRRALQANENARVLYELARVEHDLGRGREAKRLLQRALVLRRQGRP